MRPVRSVRAAAPALLLCALACGAPEDRSTADPMLDPPPGLGLQPVPAPDFATMEAGVETQMREVHDALRDRIGDPGATARELSRAYGAMANLLMAARDLRTAEPYYRNALALDPSDRRWAYYLGHLYRNRGPLAEAAASFEHARELAPDDVATLVWLGDAYLALGRPDDAQALFGRAVELDPRSAAAWYGAGRVALAAGGNARRWRRRSGRSISTPAHRPPQLPARARWTRRSWTWTGPRATCAVPGTSRPNPPDPPEGPRARRTCWRDRGVESAER